MKKLTPELDQKVISAFKKNLSRKEMQWIFNNWKLSDWKAMLRIAYRINS